MKKIILYFSLIVFSITGSIEIGFSQSSPALWIQQAGMYNYNTDDPIILHDSENHIYFLGHFRSAFKYDDVILEEKGFNSIFVSKLDTDGNLIWIKRFWHNQENYSKQLYNVNIKYAAIDAEQNLYLTGSFEDTLNAVDTVFYTIGEDHDIYLMKLNPDGDLEWFYNMEAGSPTYQRSTSLNVDEENNILLSTIDHDDKFLFKFNSSGEVLWSKEYENLGYPSSIYSVITDKENNIYMSGRFKDYIVFENDTICSLAGNEYNGFYAKFDEYGDYLWARLIGSYCPNGVNPQLQIDTDLNIHISCIITDCAIYFGSDSIVPMDIYNKLLVKLNQEGDVLWWHQVYSHQDIYDNILELDIANNTYFAVNYYYNNYIGFSNIIYPGEGRFLVVKLNPEGEIQWIKNPGGAITWDLRLKSIAPDNTDNLYVTGDFSGLAIFGDTSFYSPGFTNSIFLSKIDEYSWVKESGITTPEFPAFKIGPNPASEVLEVNFLKQTQFSYKVYNINGILVNSGQTFSGKASIDLQAISPGIYIIRLRSDHVEKVMKFIKK